MLFVCTANKCRSPLAEFALARAVRSAGLAWSIGSAGTRAVPGRGPDREVVSILTERGEDLAGWRSRRVSPELLADSDLILVMSRAHRSEIGMLDPAALSRTFLLLNVAAYRADGVGGADPGEAVLSGPELVAVARRSAARPAVEPLEVADPVGRSRRMFRQCARELDQAAASIVFGRAGLAPGPARTGLSRLLRRRS